MNNKGFTLLELIGVILLLSILIGVVSISVDVTIKNSKTNLSKTQIENIEKAANVYYLKEGMNNKYNNSEFQMCVNIDYLIDNDYIEDEKILDLKDDKELEGSVVITYSSDTYNYKYQEKDCDYKYKSINDICISVTEKTKTTGNIPEGNYLPGDEYICEVKENVKYHFFVLSKEKDKVNLVLDRNINSDGTLVTTGIQDTDVEEGQLYNMMPWAESGINDEGPITALTFLNKATEDWSNIENLNELYEDEAINSSTALKSKPSYGSIELTGKARMPKYKEMLNAGCTRTYGSCPIWLSNYVHDIYSPYDNIYSIENVAGYWILSSNSYNNEHAWMLFDSSIYSIPDTGPGLVTDSGFGVRPVISVSKSKMSIIVK